MRMNVPILFSISDLSVQELEAFRTEIDRELTVRRELVANAEEIAMAKSGNRIGAIKTIKARTGCLLKDALEILDRDTGVK